MDSQKIAITYSDAKYESLLNINVLHCLHTLMWQGFERDDICVFYTPPQADSRFEQHLSQFAHVVRRQHIDMPYPKLEFPYQDKFWYTELEGERVVYADADVEFQRGKDIMDLYGGDFDIAGYNPYPDGMYPRITGRFPFNYIGGHFYLMDHGFHQVVGISLREVATKMMSGEIPYERGYDRVLDEFITSWIAKDYKRFYLSYKTIPWAIPESREAMSEAYILHGGGRRVMCAGHPYFAREVLSEQLYPLVMENTNTVGYKHHLERLVAVLLTLLEEDSPEVKVSCDIDSTAIYVNFTDVVTDALLEPYRYLYIGFQEQLGLIAGRSVKIGIS